MNSRNLQVGVEVNANVKGQESIEELTKRLDDASVLLGGEFKTRAQQASAELRNLAAQDAAIQAFLRLQKEAQNSARELKGAEREAANYAKQISALGPPTEREAMALQKLHDAASDSNIKLAQQQSALAGASVELQRYGVASQNTQAAQTRLAQQTQVVRDSVKDLTPAYQSVAADSVASASKQAQASKQVASGLSGLTEQLTILRNVAGAALGGSFIGSLAKDVADTADAYNNLQARIKLVTGEGAAFTTAFEGITAVAQRTSSSLESTGNLFTKIAESGKAMGVGQADALKLTETINQAVQLSGASAQASDAAITQLIQGLQSGVVRGDEFNSIMEQAPRLSRALAEGLGVTTGELRKMAEAGALSSDVVIKALRGQADVVSSEFSKLPPTVGRAITNLSTSWALYVGETDKATGASATAAGAINGLATNLKTVAGYLIDASQAGALFVALKLAQHFSSLALNAGQSAVAVTANAAAITATSAASTTAAANVGRFAAILGGLKTLTLVGLISNFHDIGVAIGEGAAKLVGYKDRTNELAAAEKTAAAIAAETVAMRKRMAEATQDAIDKQFDLTKACTKAIAEFDKLTKDGSTAADAIAKIGKDFDLSTIPGIQNASRVLNKLAADGKISAGEFQAAWSEALKGQDLALFEVKFKTGMLQLQADAKAAGIALENALAKGLSGKELKEFEDKARDALAASGREAERLGQVLDASLRESIKRTGLDFDVISGGMGKASRSAINDTDAMIARLDRLKAMGLDTAQVLAASLGKGIDTADSQKAIEAVKLQIESVRKALGDKVADGLLDQAKQKSNELADALDKAKPGINSVREAMKLLGVTSDQTFKDTAEKSKAAYDAMKVGGTSSARELADGFKKMAADQIASSGEVGSAQRAVTEAVLKTEGAVRGLSVTFDSSGKMIVQTQAEAAAAIAKTTGALESQKDAVDSVTSALERKNAVQERANAAIEKAAELERKHQNVDKEGYMLNTAGERISISKPTERSVYENAKGQGLTEAQALQITNQFIQNGQQTGYGNANSAAGENWGTELQKSIDKQVLANAAKAGNTDSRGISSTPTSGTAPVSTRTVNINLSINNSRKGTVDTSPEGATVMQNFMDALQQSKLSSGL